MTEKAQQRKLAKWAALEKAQLQSALCACAATPEGRVLLWWLFEITKADRNPFTGEWGGTAFSCGEFNIGQMLKAELIDADPMGYVNLLQEKASERDSRARELDDAGSDDRAGYTEHDPGDDTDD